MAFEARRRRRGRRRGIALILALLVLSILVVVVTQFSYSVKVENRIVQNGRDDQQLSVAARGAVPFVAALFRDDRKNGKTPPDADTLADCWDDPHLPDLCKVQLGDVTLLLTIEDLDRRLSLDWFTIDARQAYATTVLKRLLDKLQTDGDHDKIAKAIRDKVREVAGLSAIPDQGTQGGAPAPAPAPAPSPLQPGEQAPPAKRGILDLDELLTVQLEGVEMRKVLWGDPSQNPPKVGIAGFVTCWCTDTFNLNTMPGELLYASLPQQNADSPPKQLWDDATATQIVEAIQKHRIDPVYLAQQQQQNGQTGQPAPSPPPSQPGTGGTTDGQAGASKSWPGKPYEKVTELSEIQLLASLFGGTTPTVNGQPGSQPPPQTQPPSSGTPSAGTLASGPFGFKTALAVSSRYYAILVRASNAAGATKTVRMVVARNNQDEVTPLLIREEPR